MKKSGIIRGNSKHVQITLFLFNISPTLMELKNKNRYSKEVRRARLNKSDDLLQSDADTKRIVKEIELTQLSKSSDSEDKDSLTDELTSSKMNKDEEAK